MVFVATLCCYMVMNLAIQQNTPFSNSDGSLKQPYGGISGNSVVVEPSVTERYTKAYAVVFEGDELLKKGNINEAINKYRDALKIDPDIAVYSRLAEAYTKKGDVKNAIKWFRGDMYPRYPNQPFGSAWSSELMHLRYALLLLHSGTTKQLQEAVYIYNTALPNLNYASGKPRNPVLLPEIGNDVGQIRYSSKMLEALVYTGLSIAEPDDAVRLEQAEKAATVISSEPLVRFYQAEALRRRGRNEEARIVLEGLEKRSSLTIRDAVQESLRLIGN